MSVPRVSWDAYQRTIKALLHTTDELFTHEVEDEIICTRAEVEEWLRGALQDEDLLDWINGTGLYSREAAG